MSEGKPQPELPRQRTAVIGRTEQEDLRTGRPRRLRLDLTERVIVGHVIVEKCREVLHLIGKIIGRRITPLPHRHRRRLIAARRATDAEVDTPRKQRLKHAELLGDFQRAVIRQQHAAGANADFRSGGRKSRNQDFRAGIGQRHDRMMFGTPVTVKTHLLGGLRET